MVDWQRKRQQQGRNSNAGGGGRAAERQRARRALCLCIRPHSPIATTAAQCVCCSSVRGQNGKAGRKGGGGVRQRVLKMPTKKRGRGAVE